MFFLCVFHRYQGLIDGEEGMLCIYMGKFKKQLTGYAEFRLHTLHLVPSSMWKPCKTVKARIHSTHLGTLEARAVIGLFITPQF